MWLNEGEKYSIFVRFKNKYQLYSVIGNKIRVNNKIGNMLNQLCVLYIYVLDGVLDKKN